MIGVAQGRQRRRDRPARVLRARRAQPDGAAPVRRARPAQGRHRELPRGPGRGDGRRQQPRGPAARARARCRSRASCGSSARTSWRSRRRSSSGSRRAARCGSGPRTSSPARRSSRTRRARSSSCAAPTTRPRAAATRPTAAGPRRRSTGCPRAHARPGRGAPLRAPVHAPRPGRGRRPVRRPRPGLGDGPPGAASSRRSPTRRWARPSSSSAWAMGVTPRVHVQDYLTEAAMARTQNATATIVLRPSGTTTHGFTIHRSRVAHPHRCRSRGNADLTWRSSPTPGQARHRRDEAATRHVYHRRSVGARVPREPVYSPPARARGNPHGASLLVHSALLVALGCVRECRGRDLRAGGRERGRRVCSNYAASSALRQPTPVPSGAQPSSTSMPRLRSRMPASVAATEWNGPLHLAADRDDGHVACDGSSSGVVRGRSGAHASQIPSDGLPCAFVRAAA